MRKTSTIMVASLVLTVLMALAGCGEDHGHRYRTEGDRNPSYERRDNDRREDRPSDRRDDRGRESGREGEHGDR